MHLAIIGRVDPLISLSRLRVGGELTEIRSEHLRFTKMEATAFLNDLMSLDLSLDDINALGVRTEGWVAGLQLAALSLQGREDKHEFIAEFSGIHHHLIDYLVDEVLSRQPDEIRLFLCRTSILERFNESLCNATLDISNSQQILEVIDETNLFLVPLDEERRWFRYHHLFSDFLVLCLQDEQSVLIPDLHRRAAKWYLDNNYAYEAFSHILAAEDYSEAAYLVEQSAREMLERSELAQLMKWVAQLPEEYVQERPRLSIYHTWALRLSGSQYDVVESRINDIEFVLDKSTWNTSNHEPRGLYDNPEDELRNLTAHLFALKAFQGIYREDFSHALEMAEKSNSYQPDERFVHSSLEFVSGWAYRLSGDLEAAYKAFSGSSALSQASGNVYMAVTTQCRAAYGQVLGGKLHQAEQSFQDALNLATREDGRQNPVAGYAYVYLGGIQFEWNNLEVAGNYSLEGIDLCERVGFIMDQAVGFANLAKIKIAEGDLSAAQEACQSAWELSQLMKDYVYTRRWVEDCQVRLWIAQKDQEALTKWVQTSDLQLDDTPNFKRDIDHVILARALVGLGKMDPTNTHIEDALVLLSNLLDLAGSAKWNGKAVEILVLQAMALCVEKNEEDALFALESALSLAEPGGYIRSFVDGGRALERLLRKVDNKEISSNYIKKLLAAFSVDKSMGQVRFTQSLFEPLSPRELDVLRMLATDLSGPEIASEMNIALTTLRSHTKNIYTKLEVNNRRSAVRNAQEMNLI